MLCSVRKNSQQPNTAKKSISIFFGQITNTYNLVVPESRNSPCARVTRNERYTIPVSLFPCKEMVHIKLAWSLISLSCSQHKGTSQRRLEAFVCSEPSSKLQNSSALNPEVTAMLELIRIVPDASFNSCMCAELGQQKQTRNRPDRAVELEHRQAMHLPFRCRRLDVAIPNSSMMCVSMYATSARV